MKLIYKFNYIGVFIPISSVEFTQLTFNVLSSN